MTRHFFSFRSSGAWDMKKWQVRTRGDGCLTSSSTGINSRWSLNLGTVSALPWSSIWVISHVQWLPEDDSICNFSRDYYSRSLYIVSITRQSFDIRRPANPSCIEKKLSFIKLAYCIFNSCSWNFEFGDNVSMKLTLQYSGSLTLTSLGTFYLYLFVARTLFSRYVF